MVGGTVDIIKIVEVGVEANVVKTTTTGKTGEVGIECTGYWTCSAVITPQIMVVKGEKFHNKDQGCGEDKQLYEVRLPVLDGDNRPLVHIERCVCKNYLYWAEAGDLSPCPKECTPNKGPLRWTTRLSPYVHRSTSAEERNLLLATVCFGVYAVGREIKEGAGLKYNVLYI